VDDDLSSTTTFPSLAQITHTQPTSSPLARRRKRASSQWRSREGCYYSTGGREETKAGFLVLLDDPEWLLFIGVEREGDGRERDGIVAG
jgi:hypothetical protein